MVQDPDRTVLVVLVFAVGVLWIAGWSPQLVPQPVHEERAEPELVPLDERGPQIWPYTSTRPDFGSGVSPINMAFDEDPKTVRRLFLESGGPWNATGESEPERSGDPTEPPALVGWHLSGGAARYVYVTEDGDASGGWREPAYHLYRGEYFGTQRHLRVFDASVDDRSWTVVQVHSEHWDWFSLTHRVDSVDRPREEVERELFDHRRVDSIERVYHGNGDAFDADGWTTVVTIAGILVVPATRRRLPAASDALRDRPDLDAIAQRLSRGSITGRSARWAGLAMGLAGMVLGVRAAGLAAEAVGLPSGPVSKLLYGTFAVGVPLVALYGGRRLDRSIAFWGGAGGFAFGLIADYAVLSVTVLSLVVAVHRTLAVVAVGVLATALAVPEDDGRPRLAVGLALWLLVLVVAHVGL